VPQAAEGFSEEDLIRQEGVLISVTQGSYIKRTPVSAYRAQRRSGGALFLHTDNFWADYRHMQAHGIRSAETPREERDGRVVVFYDRYACRLYGNKWDLVQPAQS
jgi:DNA gyrase/topoisomerase IV subunit A